jgi:heme ABC exporter ATP-binding subunit CcmA
VSQVDFASVTLAEVSRTFGRRRALARVSFAARRGDILGLLGHNGAGKSTLLAILATLLRPSTGSVRYGDVDAAEAGPAIRARLGLLGHELQLYPELTAAENLTFFAKLHGLDDVGPRVDAALESARLAERRDDVVSGFSRGMRQRLALERALLHAPRLLLLDEPFTGLDQASTASLVERLRRLAEGGIIVVLATHDLDLVEGLLTRAVILKDGKVAALYDDGRSVRDRYVEALRGQPAPPPVGQGFSPAEDPVGQGFSPAENPVGRGFSPAEHRAGQGSSPAGHEPS